MPTIRSDLHAAFIRFGHQVNPMQLRQFHESLHCCTVDDIESQLHTNNLSTSGRTVNTRTILRAVGITMRARRFQKARGSAASVKVVKFFKTHLETWRSEREDLVAPPHQKTHTHSLS